MSKEKRSGSEGEYSSHAPTDKSFEAAMTAKQAELAAENIDDNEHRRITRKIDRHILPLVSLLYLLSFLDRANIGNARVAGMGTDLHLVGLRYNICAAVFFVLYSFAEVPSNMALKIFRPSVWIPIIMIAWGIVMTLMSLVKSFKGLLIARIFLGLCEAGLFPGVNFYISLWYRRAERSLRIAIFFSAATVAGAFGGLLAFGIEKMEGIGGLHGWAWIFLLEGLATVLIAAFSFFKLHDYPETAKFLTETERAIVVRRLQGDSQGLATHFDMRFFWQAVLDYKTYIQIGLYMGVLIPVYAIALFLPSIIAALGFTAANAQLLSVPPYAAGCLFTLVVGYYSDKHHLRGPYIVSFCIIAIIGYIVLYTQTSAVARYIGSIIATVGVFPTIAVAIAWAAGNSGGDLKRGVVIAMVIGVGNLGGICSSFVYIDPPKYHIGHGTMMGWLGFTVVLSCVAMFVYHRENQRKENMCREENLDESKAALFTHMGDESPLYRYTI